jgi:hypothetical protein
VRLGAMNNFLLGGIQNRNITFRANCTLTNKGTNQRTFVENSASIFQRRFGFGVWALVSLSAFLISHVKN